VSMHLRQCRSAGSVAEWLKAPVLKTGNGQPFVGSNPTASASYLGWASITKGSSVFTHNFARNLARL
jgi:hypothetical protein